MGMHWNHYRYALEAPWVCTGGLWLYSTGGPMGMGWRLNGIIVLQSVLVGLRPYGYTVSNNTNRYWWFLGWF